MTSKIIPQSTLDPNLLFMQFDLDQDTLKKFLNNIYSHLFRQQQVIQSINASLKTKMHAPTFISYLEKIARTEIKADELLLQVNKKINMEKYFQEPIQNESQAQEMMRKFQERIVLFSQLFEVVNNKINFQQARFESIEDKLKQCVQIDRYKRDQEDQVQALKGHCIDNIRNFQDQLTQKIDLVDIKITDLINQNNHMDQSVHVKLRELETQIRERITEDQLNSFSKLISQNIIYELNNKNDLSFQELKSQITSQSNANEMFKINVQQRINFAQEQIKEISEIVNTKCVYLDTYSSQRQGQDERIKEHSLKIQDLFRKAELLQEIEMINKTLNHINKDIGDYSKKIQSLSHHTIEYEEKLLIFEHQLSTIDLNPEKIQKIYENLDVIKNQCSIKLHQFQTELNNTHQNTEKFQNQVLQQLQIVHKQFYEDRLSKAEVVAILEREIQGQTTFKNRLVGVIQQSMILPNGAQVPITLSNMQAQLTVLNKKIVKLEKDMPLPFNIIDQVKEQQPAQLGLQIVELQEQVKSLQYKIDKAHGNKLGTDTNLDNGKCLLCGSLSTFDDPKYPKPKYPLTRNLRLRSSIGSINDGLHQSLQK